jgi:hypothetical protein
MQPCNHSAKRIISSNGMTLVELVLAVILSSVIISFIALSTELISGRISHSIRSGNLKFECVRFANTISARIRRSGCVVSYTEQSISFINHESGDTVSLEHQNGRLLENGNEMKYGREDFIISDFLIEKIGTGTSLTGECDLLKIEITAENSRGKKTEAIVNLAVKRGG